MKTVLISGGSRGIGAAMVKCFSEAGYRVAFTYNKSENMATELAVKYGALAIKADSGNPTEIELALNKFKEEIGSPDILINNAAISSFSMLQDLSLEEWERTFSVNVTAAFLYSKGVIPEMVNKKQGRIINISSVWGLVGSSCEVHYSASKAALIGMTKALAKELAPAGICVNAIAPGVIATDMNSSLSDDDMKVLTEEIPLGRLGKADEVAKAALYLASREASYITGEVLNISGGFTV